MHDTSMDNTNVTVNYTHFARKGILTLDTSNDMVRGDNPRT